MHVCPSSLSFILYNPIRKILTDREQVMDESGINEQSAVLEIGAGNGFFTEALARRAKKVYAVELQEGMVRKLKRRVQHFGPKIEIIQADIAQYDPGMAIADVALLYYSFHEISNQADAAKIIGNAVRPGGILVIYEPTIEVGKAAMEKTVRLFEAAGFERKSARHHLFTRFVKMKKSMKQ